MKIFAIVGKKLESKKNPQIFLSILSKYPKYLLYNQFWHDSTYNMKSSNFIGTKSIFDHIEGLNTPRGRESEICLLKIKMCLYTKLSTKRVDQHNIRKCWKILTILSI